MTEQPPSFFILGTQKGGTSTLHYWLSQHPELSLPHLKETHYFSHDDRFQYGIEWYYDWFVPKGKEYIRGEVDPSYMFFPKTSKRIKALCPNPKFIVILREPLARAYSHYLMSTQRGYETLEFVQALEREKSRLENDSSLFSFEHHSYLTRGNYSEQIRRYQLEFPTSSFLFLRFDDLSDSSSRKEMFQKICRFITISPDTSNIDLDTVIRPASTSRFHFIRDLVYGNRPIRRWGKKFIPLISLRAAILNTLDKLNKKPIQKKPQLDLGVIPQAIKQKINHEIDSLSSLTGMDIAHWRYSS